MARHLTVAERVRPAATRHLIHRPRSAVQAAPEYGVSREERFALAGDMPYDHPLFNDGLGHVHDVQLFVETVRQVGTFVGGRYFRVPLDRRCRFESVEFALTTPAAWRVRENPSHMAVDLHASALSVTSGIPGGLRLRGTMEIDGTAGCTGHADLRFLAPSGPRRPAPTRWSSPTTGRHGPPPVDPHTVGRCDPRNVVVSAPARTDDTLRTELLVDPGHPVFFAESGEFVPGTLLIEAIRQTALLAATRIRGYDASRTHVVRASVRFPRDAALGLPLTCAARVDPGDDAPSTSIRSSVTQLGSVVAEAELTVAHSTSSGGS
ncbi:AfsA-related hotdog domain-containing protein [Micromonospora sp. WMMD1120]|uniref:AfsA-related hotdog domain-containing protein n=1 Tax=Micromonospora sp. WMMD1120 TaxID=3016106 RepID=UPI002416CD62|nr:AfsA-related hotdog domain-containing protein [Micromonospora sp. WMMD1120]MDG4809538.1 AfsA-related hotdog domain-containing protein [Micromonospora sp. WMMD1120]